MPRFYFVVFVVDVFVNNGDILQRGLWLVGLVWTAYHWSPLSLLDAGIVSTPGQSPSPPPFFILCVLSPRTTMEAWYFFEQSHCQLKRCTKWPCVTMFILFWPYFHLSSGPEGVALIPRAVSSRSHSSSSNFFYSCIMQRATECITLMVIQ